MLVSRIQIIGPGENNFVKWKEKFRSDRLDQIRSVSVNGSHSQDETIRACAKAGWGQCLIFLSTGKVTLIHETGFLHIKGIKTSGIRNFNREGIRKKFQILEKNNSEALLYNLHRKDYSSCRVDERTVVIIIWHRKELSNLDNLEGFSMYLEGNCRWVPLSTIA